MVLKMEAPDLTNEQPATPSKPTGHGQAYGDFGSVMAAELMIGFWFGARVMLAVGVANGLNHFVRVVTRGK